MIKSFLYIKKQVVIHNLLKKGMEGKYLLNIMSFI